MNRLTHSAQGFRRYMQMSGNSVFVFVEGRDDRYFYDKVCQSVCHNHSLLYEVSTAKELSGGGGKTSLLHFFGYLKKAGSLDSALNGKRTLVVFYLDKDVDDLKRTIKRSKHLIYTRYYELENYLFRHGDITAAAAAASLLDSQSVERGLPDKGQWLSAAGLAWKDWAKLCLFARLKKINCACSYGMSTSPINKGAYGGRIESAYQTHLNTLRNAGCYPQRQFDSAFLRLSNQVDQLYEKGDQDIIFKGKWYFPFLREEVKRLARHRSCNVDAFDERVSSCLCMTLDYSAAWAEHLRDPLSKLIQPVA